MSSEAPRLVVHEMDEETFLVCYADGVPQRFRRFVDAMAEANRLSSAHAADIWIGRQGAFHLHTPHHPGV